MKISGSKGVAQERGAKSMGGALAILGYNPSVPPAAFLPHGTDHSAHILCQAIEHSEEYECIHYFDDILPPGLNFSESHDFSVTGESRPLLEAFRLSVRYEAVYLAKGLLRWSFFGLRSPETLTPIISEVGTAHHPNQWNNLLYAALSGSIRSSDGFIFKSQRTRAIFQNMWTHWAERFNNLPSFQENVVIPNAVDAGANRKNLALREKTRSDLHIGPDDVVFLSFSRLAPITKLDFNSLIRLWKEVVSNYKTAYLIIAGALISSPDYRQYPEILRGIAREAGVAQNVIILPGPFERWPNAKNALMSAADVFIHTTRGIEEACPNVILEAMSHEMPVIASDWSGIEGLVLPYENGWLIDSWVGPLDSITSTGFLSRSHQSLAFDLEDSVGIDANQLFCAIKACMDKGTRKEAGSRALQHIHRSFLPDKIAKQRIDFFKEVSHNAYCARGLASPVSPLIDLEHIVAGLAKRKIKDSTQIIFDETQVDSVSLSPVFLSSPGRDFLTIMRQVGNTTVDRMSLLLENALSFTPPRQLIGKLVASACSLGLIRLRE